VNNDPKKAFEDFEESVNQWRLITAATLLMFGAGFVICAVIAWPHWLAWLIGAAGAVGLGVGAHAAVKR
jgi:uncharacterized membrane protein